MHAIFVLFENEINNEQFIQQWIKIIGAFAGITTLRETLRKMPYWWILWYTERSQTSWISCSRKSYEIWTLKKTEKTSSIIVALFLLATKSNWKGTTVQARIFFWFINIVIYRERYPVVHRALRTLNQYILVQMGFFIKDPHEQNIASS